MRFRIDQRLGVGQHPAPGRRWRLRAKADVGQGRFGEDAEGKLDRRLHDQKAGDVGQDVLHADETATFARDTRGHDIIQCPERQRPAPRHTGENRDVEDADGQDCIEGRGAEDSGDQDGDDQRGKGEDQVVAAHDDFVQPATVPGRCRKTQRHARANADADRDQRHGDRGARACHQHREQVPPEMIGAERVC